VDKNGEKGKLISITTVAKGDTAIILDSIFNQGIWQCLIFHYLK